MADTTHVSKQFMPARAKLWIGSLDDPKLEIRAQYNPKELQIDKQVTWQDHKSKDNRSGKDRVEKSTQGDLEYNGAPKRSMSLELLFDGYEEGRSIEGEVAILDTLSSSRNPESPQEDERRPHHCIVAWGHVQEGIRPFRCVIDSLSVRYTMWNSTGVPLRATCTVKLTEATKLSSSGETTDYRNRGDDAEVNRRYQRDLARREAEYRDETQRQIDKRKQIKKA